ncbi:hypothetical protein B0H16DRAFT_7767 [Mycena metata]|uniref:Carbonic anhydrase n=1 Tax=Mycena metata TaxID=1033252 RepID=A0AAD7KIX7_9AGAR|nr:hypothetical protein B0H16DRAFT_7767 [Mycena metata]
MALSSSYKLQSPPLAFAVTHQNSHETAHFPFPTAMFRKNPVAQTLFSHSHGATLFTTAQRRHTSFVKKEKTAEPSAPPIALPPTKRLAIVTCMDARIKWNPVSFDYALSDAFSIPSSSLGSLRVMRISFGMPGAWHAIRSLVISQRLLGTRNITIYRHTGCCMVTFAARNLSNSSSQWVRPDSTACAEQVDA